MKTQHMRSLITEFLIKFANQFIFATLMVTVYERSQNAIDMGYMSVAMIIPAIIFTFFSNKIIHGIGSLRTVNLFLVLRAAILLLAAYGVNNLFAYMIIGGTLGLVQQIIGTAKLSYDSILVSSDYRIKFNSHRAFISSISLILGLSIGGSLTGYLGGGKAMLAISIITIISIFIPAKLSSSQNNIITKKDKTNSLNSYLEIIKYLRNNNKVLIIVTTYIIVAAILEMEAPLIFPFVKEVYNGGGEIAGTLLGVCGFGGLLGALYINKREKMVTVSTISLLVIFDGICLFIFAKGLPIIAGYIIFGFLGIIGTLTLVTVETEVQESVPVKIQPMIFSLLQFAGGVGGASITMISTSLADIYGVANVLQWSAGLEVLVGVVSFLLFLKLTLIAKNKGIIYE